MDSARPFPGGNGPVVQALDSTREGRRVGACGPGTQGEAGKATVYVYCGRKDPLLTTASSAPTLVAKDELASIPAAVRVGR